MSRRFAHTGRRNRRLTNRGGLFGLLAFIAISLTSVVGITPASATSPFDLVNYKNQRYIGYVDYPDGRALMIGHQDTKDGGCNFGGPWDWNIWTRDIGQLDTSGNWELFAPEAVKFEGDHNLRVAPLRDQYIIDSDTGRVTMFPDVYEGKAFLLECISRKKFDFNIYPPRECPATIEAIAAMTNSSPEEWLEVMTLNNTPTFHAKTDRVFHVNAVPRTTLLAYTITNKAGEPDGALITAGYENVDVLNPSVYAYCASV